MSRKTETGDDYEVGYRRPPKHSQFKKGQSGNPRGRPKRAEQAEQYEWKNILDKVLIDKINVVVDGKKGEMTNLEAMIRKAVRLAQDGSARHLKLVLDGTTDRAIERVKIYESEADRAYMDAVWEALDKDWRTGAPHGKES